MKPEQFIREYGVDKAREVVEGAPNLSLFYDLEKQKHVLKESTSIAMAFLKNRFLPIEDLKRLVELLDIVRVIGPIEYTRSVVTNAPVNAIGYDTMYEGYFGEETKHYYENLRTFTIDQIKDAVAVHESIYGGGDE